MTQTHCLDFESRTRYRNSCFVIRFSFGTREYDTYRSVVGFGRFYLKVLTEYLD